MAVAVATAVEGDEGRWKWGAWMGGTGRGECRGSASARTSPPRSRGGSEHLQLDHLQDLAEDINKNTCSVILPRISIYIALPRISIAQTREPGSGGRGALLRCWHLAAGREAAVEPASRAASLAGGPLEPAPPPRGKLDDGRLVQRRHGRRQLREAHGPAGPRPRPRPQAECGARGRHAADCGARPQADCGADCGVCGLSQNDYRWR